MIEFKGDEEIVFADVRKIETLQVLLITLDLLAADRPTHVGLVINLVPDGDGKGETAVFPFSTREKLSSFISVLVMARDSLFPDEKPKSKTGGN